MEAKKHKLLLCEDDPNLGSVLRITLNSTTMM